MQNCRNRICNAVINLFERVISFLLSPFKLDKLFGIAGIGLITSPSLFDMTGEVKINSQHITSILKFTNGISVFSYILGGVLCIFATYIFHKREFKVHDLSRYKELDEANKNLNSGALLQFTFASIFKFSPTIEAIKHLLSTDDPLLNITDYKNARGLVSFDKKFTLINSKTKLETIKTRSDIVYYIFSLLIIFSYIASNVQYASGGYFWSIIWLTLSIIFFPIAYMGFSAIKAAASAERLLELSKDKVLKQD